MASAQDPTTAVAANIFNEVDLLDDDDDDESEDDDSAFSITADRHPPPPSSSAAAQVTVAVTGVPDLQLHQPQQQQEIIVATKKPAAHLDESRKLFQRLWTDEDEIELLQGFLEYTTLRGGPHSSSHHHHHDTTAFYDQIKDKFQLDFNKNQLVEKLRRLKKKYRNVISKFGSGKDYAFKSHHDQLTFEFSSKIWGTTNNNGGGGGSYAYRATPIMVDEDEDDPNFADFQSPTLNGMNMNINMIDVNSKTPKSRKRNRVGVPVKLEEKPTQPQPHPINSHNNNNNNNNHTSVPIAVAPISAIGGISISGQSLSNVIEETVKSCISPIFKELLGSMNHNPPPSCGSNTNNGFAAMGLSPMPPLGFGGDRSDDKWRKQQILELEVFSKRLKLVQDQIDDQLQELKSSLGNNNNN